jgi:hypothetical protein
LFGSGYMAIALPADRVTGSLFQGKPAPERPRAQKSPGRRRGF